MDILKSIKKALKETGGQPPWSCGLDSERASKASLGAWSLLTEEERLGISRFNPSKILRNNLIYKLHKEGFTQFVLHQLSGLSFGQIKRITVKK